VRRYSRQAFDLLVLPFVIAGVCAIPFALIAFICSFFKGERQFPAFWA